MIEAESSPVAMGRLAACLVSFEGDIMAIEIICECRGEITLDETSAREIVKCPECGRETVAPGTTASAPEASPSEVQPLPVEDGETEVTSGRAIAALALGAASWPCFPRGPFGIVLAILGLSDLSRASRRVALASRAPGWSWA